MSSEDQYTYVKRDEDTYFLLRNGVNTNFIVTSYCPGCEPMLFGRAPAPNQLEHYDGCLSDEYYNDGRYNIFKEDDYEEKVNDEEEEENIDSSNGGIKKRMRK